MESPEDIEKALARLVPSAISDQGQRSLEDLIDSLAAGETAVVEMPSPRRKPWGWMAGGAGAAAAAVTLALLVPAGEPGPRRANSPKLMGLFDRFGSSGDSGSRLGGRDKREGYAVTSRAVIA